MKNNRCWMPLLLSTLLFAGCAGASTTISDGDQTIMKVGDTTYTRNDEYQLIKRINGPSLTLQGAQRLIYDQEVGDGDDIKKEAEEMYKMYEGTSDDFEAQLQSYGYKDKQDYIDNVLIPSVQSSHLLKKYFEDGKDAIEAEFKPTVAVVIQCENEDNAKKAQEALKNGDDPVSVGTQYAQEGTEWNGSEKVITTLDTSLPVRIVNTLYETTKEGVLDEIFSDDTSTDNKSYYAVKLISSDYDANIDKIAETLSSNADINTDCVVYYLDKYEFQVYDQYIFDYFKTNNPEYLVTRPDLSE